MKKSKAIVLIILSSLISGLLVFYLVTNMNYIVDDKILVDINEYNKIKGIRDRFQKVLELEDRIKKEYYQDVSKIDFDDAIMKGLFAGLDDPYSSYMNKEDYKKYSEQINGEYSGIGVYINTKEKAGNIVIKEIMENSPAQKYKLKAGDIILKVDGKEVSLDKIDKAISMIKGKAGSKVKLTIKRDDKKFDVVVVRGKVERPSIIKSVKDKNIGYIRITSFQKNTAKDFKLALDTLLKKEIKSLIIDLRFNPGGSLFEVNEIADRLLGAQKIETIVSRTGNEQVYSSDAEHKLDIPMVVLVNEYSASASEILTGAIKDGKKGTIIGQKTFGKGIVQTIKPIGDGTYYKLTTAHYLTPNGNNIHKKGIDVDIDVSKIEKEGYFTKEGNDGVLKYAVDFLKKKTK